MPQSSAVKTDLIATFRCKGQAPSDSVISWAWSNSTNPSATFMNIALNENVVIADSRYKVSYNASTALSVLSLEGVLVSDVGFIRCQLFGSSTNSYALLVVLGK